MEIQQEIIEDRGRFYIAEGDNTMAEMDYHFLDKNTFVITHTEVSESLGGNGIGRKLIMAAVEYARKNSLIIQATCPYAKKVLDRTPEFSDVYNTDKKS